MTTTACPVVFLANPNDGGGEVDGDALDGGPNVNDASVTLDAGAAALDAGDDAGAQPQDGGAPEEDAGNDAGPPSDGGMLDACGNGVVDADEECDDGNVESDDGCTAVCRLEQICTPGEALVNVSATTSNPLTSVTDNVAAIAAGQATFAPPGNGSAALPWEIELAWERPVVVTGLRIGAPLPNTARIKTLRIDIFDESGVLVRRAGPFFPRADLGVDEVFPIATVFAAKAARFIIEEIGIGTTVGIRRLGVIEAASCCGDAVWSPGETCEDGNIDDSDGCSRTCEAEGTQCVPPQSVNRVVNGGFGGGLSGFQSDPIFVASVTDDREDQNCASGRVAVARSPFGADFSDDSFGLTGWGAMSTEHALWSTTTRLLPGDYRLEMVMTDRSVGVIQSTFSVRVNGVVQETSVVASDAGAESVAQSVPFVVVGVGAAPIETEVALFIDDDTCPGNEFYLDRIALVPTAGLAAELPYCSPCGDGIVVGSEGCDDGNQSDGDGCSAACVVEGVNVACPVAGAPCFRLELSDPEVASAGIGEQGENPEAQLCPTGTVLTGWRHRYGGTPVGAYVRTMIPSCAPFTLEPNGSVVIGVATELPPLGPYGDFDNDADVRCVDGARATAVSARTFLNHVRALGSTCAESRMFNSGLQILNEESGAIVGYSGTTEGPDACPPGFAATGMYAENDGAARTIGLHCGAMSPVDVGP